MFSSSLKKQHSQGCGGFHEKHGDHTHICGFEQSFRHFKRTRPINMGDETAKFFLFARLNHYETDYNLMWDGWVFLNEGMWNWKRTDGCRLTRLTSSEGRISSGMSSGRMSSFCTLHFTIHAIPSTASFHQIENNFKNNTLKCRANRPVVQANVSAASSTRTQLTKYAYATLFESAWQTALWRKWEIRAAPPL